MRQEKPDVLCLLETKISSVDFEKLKWKINFDCALGVSCEGRRGGVKILWRKEVGLFIRGYRKNFIDCLIKDGEGAEPWRFTLIYRESVVSNWHETLTLLRHLNTTQSMPWVVGGDFNEILKAYKKIGVRRATCQMEDFLSALDYCGLQDLGFSGYHFT